MIKECSDLQTYSAIHQHDASPPTQTLNHSCLRDSLCSFTEINHNLNHKLNTQLSIIITSLLIPIPTISYAMYRNISKMADQSQPINPRLHNIVHTETSSGNPKLYLNLWELWNIPHSKRKSPRKRCDCENTAWLVWSIAVLLMNILTLHVDLNYTLNKPIFEQGPKSIKQSCLTVTVGGALCGVCTLSGLTPSRLMYWQALIYFTIT